MASRYPTQVKFDYCLSPVSIIVNGSKMLVPCGKCSGCLLHKSNEWCQRLSVEIENYPLSLTFTLTYSNYFLPRMTIGYGVDGNPSWTSDNSCNLRYDGTKIVCRDSPLEHKEAALSYAPVAVTHLPGEYIPYLSKRDIQLFLKILRKKLYDEFQQTNKCYRFRYFVVGEYGETLFRPHYHAILFFEDKEVCEFARFRAIYESWQMCDKSRFDEFCTYIDSKGSSYLTQYFNSVSLLPDIYKTAAFSPWRLCSKAPAIGYSKRCRSQLFESASIGDITYTRSIPDADKRYLFQYSTDYLSSLFPKCRGFSRMDFQRLCVVYGQLYYAKKRGYKYYDTISSLLSSFLSPQDWNCCRKALIFAESLESDGFTGDLIKHYVYLLDIVYYKKAMFALKMFYEYQQTLSALSMEILSLYTNLPSCLASYTSADGMYLDLFLEPFGFQASDIQDLSVREWFPPLVSDEYYKELDDILSHMVKLPKLKTDLGLHPNNNF